MVIYMDMYVHMEWLVDNSQCEYVHVHAHKEWLVDNSQCEYVHVHVHIEWLVDCSLFNICRQFFTCEFKITITLNKGLGVVFPSPLIA